MQKYEMLILTTPTITQDEIKQLESEVEKIVKKGGEVTSFEKWGKYRLAYPVKKNSYGVYFLVRFGADKEKALTLINNVHSLFTVKLEAVVMRHLLSVLDPKQPLEYVRPQSLEEAPDREGDDELSKGKIEKILSKTESKRKVSRKEVPAEELEVEEMQAEETEVVEKD